MKRLLLLTLLLIITTSVSSQSVCEAPTHLNVSDNTSGSIGVVLRYQNGVPGTTQEIILIAGSDVPPTASGNALSISAHIFTTTGIASASNLIPDTIYYYYVRTVCSSESKSDWVGPYIFNTQTCLSTNKCSYKFVLTDTNNNSWSENQIQVRQNGIAIKTFGPETNSVGPVTVFVSLCNDVPFDLYWNKAGTAQNEIGLSMQTPAPYNDPIYTKLPGMGNPFEVLYSSVADCGAPSCIKPILLPVNPDSITQTSAQLSWTPGSDSPKWEIYVAKTGAPLPINGSPLNNAPMYHISESPNYLVTGLSPATSYTYYVRALCSDTDTSAWTLLYPKSFSTKSPNDECSNAIVVPVNPTTLCNEFISGTTIGATYSLPNSTNSCSTNLKNDVWFSFTATSTVHTITISNIVGSTNYINYTLYKGDDCGTLLQLDCSAQDASIVENLVIGNTYKIKISNATSGNTQFQNFNLCITTPPQITNDEYLTAIHVPVSTSTICEILTPGNITRATASLQAYDTCAGLPDDDVWFYFTATSQSQIINFENITGYTSDLQLKYAIYTNVVPTFLACEQEQQIITNLIVGQNYYIRVWSVSSAIQDISFDICIKKVPIPLFTDSTLFTIDQLVTNVLINNPCLSISNITSSTGTNFGSTNGIGYYKNLNIDPTFPSSGLVLSTGNINQIPGPNTSVQNEGSDEWTGDTQLEAIILEATGNNMISKNASKLEFDFTSQNESMSFNFLFASKEYGFFQCEYADAFAFLLTDLTSNITRNLAVVPNTNIPISVVTIRDGVNNTLCTSANSEYFSGYFGNDNQYATPSNFNGYTKLMTASSQILPNHPYHIKLVIADRTDTAFDSAVFIQAGSFAAGPPECTDKIKMVAYMDTNGNGIKEDNEHEFTYGSFVYELNNNGILNNISSPLGFYTIYDGNPANTYNFSYTLDTEYQPYFSAGNVNYNNITIPIGSGTQTFYFPVTLTQGYNDVTVSIIPVGQPVAGFSYTTKIVYKNLGNTAASGSINFTKDPLLAIASTTQTGIINSAEGFSYNFSNLAPYESRSFNVVLNVPSIPTVNINDVLTNGVNISAFANDINAANNSYTNSQIVVASYDPNDKMEAHGEKIDVNHFNQDDYLFYTIRFQNTGTSNAITIRVEDLLDPQLDEESIRMISASHGYIMERVGNHIVWKFDYIQLPGAIQDEALSKGYITFKIKLKPGFELGDIIPNTAAIYFDTNPAIITNTYTTEFGINLGNPDFSTGNIMIYPNPANSRVQISVMNTNETIDSIILYDMLGKTISSQLNVNSKATAIDVSSLAKGVYIIEITTENKLRQVKKLVIE